MIPDQLLPRLAIGPRVRKSPFFDATRRYGAKSFTVYNHMYMPTGYTDPVDEYWKLLNGVTLWDVACERQIEVTGPDAAQLVQYLTPRNLSRSEGILVRRGDGNRAYYRIDDSTVTKLFGLVCGGLVERLSEDLEALPDAEAWRGAGI